MLSSTNAACQRVPGTTAWAATQSETGVLHEKNSSGVPHSVFVFQNNEIASQFFQILDPYDIENILCGYCFISCICLLARKSCYGKRRKAVMQTPPRRWSHIIAPGGGLRFSLPCLQSFFHTASSDKNSLD